MELAAQEMFQFFMNFLSVDAKYAWNKIAHEQTQSDPYTNIQGVSRKGPRGYLCKSFNDCIKFHLLTMFLNNMAEQERYNITNVLKNPKCVSIYQFVQYVEQLNFYIAQLPCWFYSPSAMPKPIPIKVPLTEADLASHVLRMCPLTRQNHFNLHEKGMTPVDMCLLLMSLETIECVCSQEKSYAESNKKTSNKSKKGNKRPGMESMARVPKKVCFKKHCNLCKRHGSAYTMHNTKACHNYEKDRLDSADFCTAKKCGKKPNPTKNLFAQLGKKSKKLEKAIKKQGAK